MAKRLALMFPGQGSQRVGMGSDLLRDWPSIVRDVLEEASEALQLNLRRLLAEGPQDVLTQTQYAQPAILTHSIAVLRILQHEREFDATTHSSFVLGHSLGEYSALVAAKALPFADAVRLVHFRGRAMQEAVPRDVGAMAALMPVSAVDADDICRSAAQQTQRVCEVANYNSSKQIVISGHKAAVDAAINIAKTEKKVRRAVLLDVSAPFHCALMSPAAEKLRERLDAEPLLPLQPPAVPVVWNVDARATTKSAEEMKSTLTQQVVQPVRWSESVDFCLANGVEDFLELGFGGVLTGLVKQHVPKTQAVSCGTTEQIKAWLAM